MRINGIVRCDHCHQPIEPENPKITCKEDGVIKHYHSDSLNGCWVKHMDKVVE